MKGELEINKVQSKSLKQGRFMAHFVIARDLIIQKRPICVFQWTANYKSNCLAELFLNTKLGYNF